MTTDDPDNFENRKENAYHDVDKDNRQADEVLGLFQKKLPRTYLLLAGSRFQVPPERQVDYPNYGYAIYCDAKTIVEGAVSRVGPEGDPDLWLQVGREFSVTNEWLKQGQTTLFVERELGEALKRTDLPEGFGPQDLRWRWNAFRLVLPVGLFRGEGAGAPWDVTCVTVAKAFKDRPLDFHPAISKDAKAAWGAEPLGGILVAFTDGGDSEDALMFCIQRRTSPAHKKSFQTYGGCKLDERTLRTLAEEVHVAEDSLPFWSPDLSAFLVGLKRFIFNAILYMGSLPEEYEPEKILRPFQGKKGRWKAELKEARFLGQQLYRSAHRAATTTEHEHTGRRLPGHWRCGHWKRQSYGPGNSQRKLIWVQPYRTLGHEETQNAA